MLHLRVTVPSDRGPALRDELARLPGVAHLAHLPGASTLPPGDLLLCDVVRESAHAVVEWLQEEGAHRDGAIAVEEIGTVISDAAAEAEDAVPGFGSDALVWEELEARAREEAAPTASLFVLMAVASMIAGIGILLDSPVLVVGAMVVGPEYGPLAALCVSALRSRWSGAAAAARTLVGAVGVGVLTSWLLTLALRAADLGPDVYALSDRELTAFIAHPDALAAVVAVLAGVAGMLALTEGRSGTLVGVLVSVTTIPAVANIGVAAAYGATNEMGGAAAQLGVNLSGLVLSGLATLAIQSRLTTRRGERYSRSRSRSASVE
jgi:uncharacterized hydrophobic protein (TIGR00271 family)